MCAATTSQTGPLTSANVRAATIAAAIASAADQTRGGTGCLFANAKMNDMR